MGLDPMDLLAHAAGGSLATLYAARYPYRVRRRVPITANPSAIGLPAVRAAAACGVPFGVRCVGYWFAFVATCRAQR
ncbi:hypothetical protein [Streptomyces sp. NPDC102462]|uniref:hypothetical protein n=1 Tax=Streptomyces sp. NPDC102462 TaxID=3366178 RepID=UPI0037FE1462